VVGFFLLVFGDSLELEAWNLELFGDAIAPKTMESLA